MSATHTHAPPPNTYAYTCMQTYHPIHSHQAKWVLGLIKYSYKWLKLKMFWVFNTSLSFPVMFVFTINLGNHLENIILLSFQGWMFSEKLISTCCMLQHLSWAVILPKEGLNSSCVLWACSQENPYSMLVLWMAQTLWNVCFVSGQRDVGGWGWGCCISIDRVFACHTHSPGSRLQHYIKVSAAVFTCNPSTQKVEIRGPKLSLRRSWCK